MKNHSGFILFLENNMVLYVATNLSNNYMKSYCYMDLEYMGQS